MHTIVRLLKNDDKDRKVLNVQKKVKQKIITQLELIEIMKENSQNIQY